jgi:hypothetical protein
MGNSRGHADGILAGTGGAAGGSQIWKWFIRCFMANGRSPIKPQVAAQVLHRLKEPESILKILREERMDGVLA